MKKAIAIACALLLSGWAVTLGLAATTEEAAKPDGKALYEAKCAMCHGKDGVAKPMAKGSANLNDPAWQKSVTLEQVEKVIAEGKGKMPKYSDKLKPEEIKAIATYTLSLK